jgi:hypothetical protein
MAKTPPLGFGPRPLPLVTHKSRFILLDRLGASSPSICGAILVLPTAQCEESDSQKKENKGKIETGDMDKTASARPGLCSRPFHLSYTINLELLVSRDVHYRLPYVPGTTSAFHCRLIASFPTVMFCSGDCRAARLCGGTRVTNRGIEHNAHTAACDGMRSDRKVTESTLPVPRYPRTCCWVIIGDKTMRTSQEKRGSWGKGLRFFSGASTMAKIQVIDRSHSESIALCPSYRRVSMRWRFFLNDDCSNLEGNRSTHPTTRRVSVPSHSVSNVYPA